MISNSIEQQHSTLTIGKLGQATATSVETIRYYERIGLMPNPPRTQAGYRLYDAHAVDRLRFIRKARSMEFSLHEVAELLELRSNGDTAGRSHEMAVAKVAELEAGTRRLLDAKQRILSAFGLAATTTSADSDTPLFTEQARKMSA